MFCSKCGEQVSDTASFCSKCGNALKQKAGNAVMYSGSSRNGDVKERKSKDCFKWIIISVCTILCVFLVVGILLGKKENSGVSFADYTETGSVTAYLVGPFEQDTVEIPMYVKHFGKTYYVEEIKMDESIVLQEEQLVLVEKQYKEKEFDDMAEAVSRSCDELPDFQCVNPLLIAENVMCYVKEVRMPKRSVLLGVASMESNESTTWPVDEIVAANVVIYGDEKVLQCMENVKSIECSEYWENAEVNLSNCERIRRIYSSGNVTLDGEFTELREVHGNGDIALKGSFQVLETIECARNLILDGEFPVLSVLQSGAGMQLEGKYPILQQVEIGGTPLVLKGQFNRLEKLDVKGEVSIFVAESGRCNYPKLQEVKGKLVLFDFIVSPLTMIEIEGLTDEEKNIKLYGVFRNYLPKLKKVSMNISKSKFREEAPNSADFHEFLSKKIDFIWE